MAYSPKVHIAASCGPLGAALTPFPHRGEESPSLGPTNDGSGVMSGTDGY